MSKSNQIFSTRIDEEFLALFQSQLFNIIESISPSHANKLKPEINTLIDAIYYGISLGCNLPTPGMRTFGLITNRVDNEAYTKLKLIGVFMYTWLIAKLEQISIVEGWRSEPEVCYFIL